jgi:hypothetical protein
LTLSRLRWGEWMIGGAGLVLLISTNLTWYGVSAALAPSYGQLGVGSGSRDAWSALNDVRWLILVVALLAIAVWVTQAMSRGPALPVGLTVVEVPLSLILVLLLINRVLISKPGQAAQISLRPGAVIGMFSAIAVLAGTYMSLREDGIRAQDAPREIETFRRGPRPAGAR